MTSHRERQQSTRIGIFSGTFDPVHAGHITFALEAVKQANLDEVYFLPERNPRRKQGMTHYAHRIAMLRLALKPYQKLKVLEMPDKQFSVAKTLPRLRGKFGDAELYQLAGSDMLELLTSGDVGTHWPGYDKYLQEVILIIGVRNKMEIEKHAESLKEIQPNGKIIFSHSAEVSSSMIRLAVNKGKLPKELLVSLRPYIKKHWLYASIDGVDAKSSL